MSSSKLLERVQNLRPVSGSDPRPVDLVEDEDPRFTERRAEVDYGRRRKWFRAIVVVASLMLLPLVAYTLMSSPLFDVDEVEVIGIGALDPTAVIEASGITNGDPMWRVDTDSAGLNTAGLSWVDRATVTRRWPSTVEIRVTPVEIAAVVRSDSGLLTSVAIGGTAVVNNPGEIPGTLIVDLPAELGDLEVGENLPRRYSKSLDAVAAMPDAIEAEVQSVQMDADGRLSFQLFGERTVQFGSGDSAEYKYFELSVFLNGQVDPDGICTIDVEVPSAPIARRYPDCG